MVGSRFKKRSRMVVAPCARPWPAPARTPSAPPAYGFDPRKVNPEMMPTAPTLANIDTQWPVHLVFECALADLIQAVKLQRYPSTIGEDEAVKPDGEPLLIAAECGRRGSDDAGPARDHNPLAVGRVEGHGHGREDGAGKVAVELVHEHGFDKRALIDPLPSWRVVRRVDDGGIERVALRYARAGRGPQGGHGRGLDLSPRRQRAPRVELRPGGLLRIERLEGADGIDQGHGLRRERRTRAVCRRRPRPACPRLERDRPRRSPRPLLARRYPVGGT